MSGGIFILIVLILFLVWLAIARPQRRKQARHQAVVDALKPGDEVITAGGFFVTVVDIDDDEVIVELSPGAQARLDKRAIGAVFPQEEAGNEAPEAETPDETRS